jgi:hypothetical protein
MRQADARQAEQQRRAVDRPADIALHAVFVIGADAGLDLPGQRVGRLLRDDIDRAADRIAAIERALRPAQHLDPLDIEEIGEIG